MTEKDRKYLFDIQIAINLIFDFTAGTPDFMAYQTDRKTQSAVERQLAIIGEALNKLSKQTSRLNIDHHRQIIAFRNRLVHAYDSIGNSIVWVIVKRYLPELREEINQLLT